MTLHHTHALLAAWACVSALPAQTLIDVDFPGGTGTNATFLEIDNGVGADNTWTQASGVLSTSATSNSTVGTASQATIDFTTPPTGPLVLNVEVAGMTGTPVANGIFVGLQRRINNGTGPDLWNNLPVSFGLVLPGSATIGLGVRQVAVGGNAGAGR